MFEIQYDSNTMGSNLSFYDGKLWFRFIVWFEGRRKTAEVEIKEISQLSKFNQMIFDKVPFESIAKEFGFEWIVEYLRNKSAQHMSEEKPERVAYFGRETDSSIESIKVEASEDPRDPYLQIKPFIVGQVTFYKLIIHINDHKFYENICDSLSLMVEVYRLRCCQPICIETDIYGYGYENECGVTV